MAALWKTKIGYKHITTRFDKMNAETAEGIIKAELHRLGKHSAVVLTREKMTEKMFAAWKRDHYRFKHFGGELKHKPLFQYDIYVKEHLAHLVVGRVR